MKSFKFQYKILDMSIGHWFPLNYRKNVNKAQELESSAEKGKIAHMIDGLIIWIRI